MPQTSAAPSRDPQGGFTIAETLVALAIALVLTAAASSALTVVLRAERSQWQQRHAAFQARSWLTREYSGIASETAVRLERVDTGQKDQTWQWLCGEAGPPAPGTAITRVWTRAPRPGPAR